MYSTVVVRNTESFVELTVKCSFEVEKLKVGVYLQRSFFTENPIVYFGRTVRLTLAFSNTSIRFLP